MNAFELRRTPKMPSGFARPFFGACCFPNLSLVTSPGTQPRPARSRSSRKNSFAIPNPEGWEALGRPGDVDLWKEAYRRDPSSDVARVKLVASTARFIQYTLHELPAGVLYGNNGATVEQCKDLETELAFFRGLLTSTESEQFQNLVELASVHYPAYRAYLSQNQRQGYATFLAERDGASND